MTTHLPYWPRRMFGEGGGGHQGGVPNKCPPFTWETPRTTENPHDVTRTHATPTSGCDVDSSGSDCSMEQLSIVCLANTELFVRFLPTRGKIFVFLVWRFLLPLCVVSRCWPTCSLFSPVWFVYVEKSGKRCRSRYCWNRIGSGYCWEVTSQEVCFWKVFHTP